jgi:biotin transport system substrate-specific component
MMNGVFYSNVLVQEELFMSIRNMAGAALFATLLSVISQFSFPIGVVPHTLQVFAIVLSGLVMGPKYGPLSVVIWLLLGTFGVPVFSMGHSGLATFINPTGGFLVGFVVQAWICGYCRERRLPWALLIAVVSLIAAYIIGLAGFMASFAWLLQKPMTLVQGVAVCVVPFIPFDLIKVAAAVVLGQKIYSALKKSGVDLP